MVGITRRTAVVGAVAGATLAAMICAASAQTQLKIIVFPGLSNLAQFAALSQGYYSKRGLSVELINTPNSDELRNGLAQGRYHIAHAGVDNAVAQVETDKTDLFVFMGGNNGLNNLFAQPEIGSYADLRGKTMAVDSPVTAFAILMYKMLEVKGIKRSEYEVKAVGGTPQRFAAMSKDKTYAAAILGPPFTVAAQKAGLKDFGAAVDVIGPYQSDAGWVLHSWGQANADTLVRYIQAYLEGLRWTLDPANKIEATNLIAAQFKLEPDVAAESYAIAVDPKGGMAKDAKLDMEGLKNVLRLRADWTGVTPGAPDRYIDLSYHRKALDGL